MPTVKVTDDLHGRLTRLAASEGLTIGGVISRSLDAWADSQFWAAVERTMTPSSLQTSAQQMAGTLRDGLDPDETWDDIL